MRSWFLMLLMSAVLLAAPPRPIYEAVNLVLDAYDQGSDPLPLPEVRPADRATLAWLRANLSDSVPGTATPDNPFSRGTRAFREAEAVRALLAGRKDSLKGLRLAQAGSHVGLWKWGQTQVRIGAWGPDQRMPWEDYLLQPDIHPVVRGWALRHALCFALAEADETRFLALKEAHSADLPTFFLPFQRAFSLLGGPAPRFWLWSLPDLEPVEVSLAELGTQVVIAPFESGAPAEAGWIIPAPTSNLPTQASRLEGESLREAVHLAEQTRSLSRKAYFAPSREPLEALALVYFPIEIRLDSAKRIRTLRMGDAARQMPGAQASPTP